MSLVSNLKVKKKMESIPVTGCEGPWGCEACTFPRHRANKWQRGYQPYTLAPSTLRKIPGTVSVTAGSVDSSAIGGLHCLMV
jgi:hypothetical protein